MLEISPYLHYQNIKKQFNGIVQNIHIIRMEQCVENKFTLLISKVSEAIYPFEKDNHVGQGATMDEFVQHQRGVKFVMNGGYSHYRKNFYEWSHQNFNIGDPVGFIKIRDHHFKDYITLENYGFFIQKEKNYPWQILSHEEMIKNSSLQYKYILGCTPLLIENKKRIVLPEFPILKKGQINPPSILAHGTENHPRTAIGSKGNTLYFIFVEGGIEKYVGCTLLELQEIGMWLELDSFLNLDGGGSSQFRLYKGKELITNEVHPEDSQRVLGHVLALFDKN